MRATKREIALYQPPSSTIARRGKRSAWVLYYPDGRRALAKGRSPTYGNRATSPQRERAAYLLARLLGWRTLVPPTVLGVVGGRRVSIQEWVEGGAPSRWPCHLPAKLAVLDYIIGNIDRHVGNWLLVGKRAVAIDNAFSFPIGGVPRATPSPTLAHPRWAALAADPQRIRAALEPLVGEAATDGVIDRLRKVVEASVLKGAANDTNCHK